MQPKTIFECWPFPYAPRTSQSDAMYWLEQQTAKYMIVEAPVGMGKSNLGIAYSQWLNQTEKTDDNVRKGAFILTPQKILQTQYEDSFQDIKDINLASLKGRNNYQCTTKHTNCEIGNIVKPECGMDCAHAKARMKANNSNHMVLNYKLALMLFTFSESLRSRRLMIMDEAHTLESHLVEFDALQVTYAKCKKYNLQFKRTRTLEEARNWLAEYYVPQMKKIIEQTEPEIELILDKPGNSLSRNELNKINEYNRLCQHVDEAALIVAYPFNYVNENYVLVHDEDQIAFKRMTGEHTFHTIVKPMAERFLFLSSTIINKEGFCRDLGIPPEDTAFISLDSEFPLENRPIYYIPRMKMNAQWMTYENKENRDAMLDGINLLLEGHKNDKGIIHTTNFAISEWLVKQLGYTASHTIYHHNEDSEKKRDDVIDEFMADESPSILISPSCTEGLDLKEELSRFAIIVKLGFPNLGDQWIKRRMEISSEWYKRQTLISLIQASGRVVRTDKDKGTTYILDQSFTYFRRQADGMMPGWWRDSIQTLG